MVKRLGFQRFEAFRLQVGVVGLNCSGPLGAAALRLTGLHGAFCCRGGGSVGHSTVSAS